MGSTHDEVNCPGQLIMRGHVMCRRHSMVAVRHFSAGCCCCLAGDLGRIQADANEVGGVNGGALGAMLNAAYDESPSHDRAQLESNLAAALILGSASDYRRWLFTYVRHLTGQLCPCVFLDRMCRMAWSWLQVCSFFHSVPSLSEH